MISSNLTKLLVWERGVFDFSRTLGVMAFLSIILSVNQFMADPAATLPPSPPKHVYNYLLEYPTINMPCSLMISVQLRINTMRLSVCHCLISCCSFVYLLNDDIQIREVQLPSWIDVIKINQQNT